MAVVKADGYGHDAREFLNMLLKVELQLGVATLKEGIKLRSSGVKNQFLFWVIFIQKKI